MAPLRHHNRHDVNHIPITRVQRIKARIIQRAFETRARTHARLVIVQFEHQLVGEGEVGFAEVLVVAEVGGERDWRQVGVVAEAGEKD